MAGGGKGPKKSTVNGWEALRDVLLASLNKGQFPLAVVGLIVLVIIVRMPSADVAKLAFSIVAELHSGYLLGYAVALSVTLGWFFHAKRMRRLAANELKRVAAERTRLQENNAGTRLKSSAVK